ncbi:MAG: F0F1 ATP synthase subunit B [Chloroflexi bacterium]|nr:F0F1 ATP synthase subunit B [Chloroflexota bacterium]
MEALGINLGYLIVQILNFGVLFVVLRAWVYKPLLGQLDKRRQMVAQGLEDARVAGEARANAETEASKIITDAQIKANEVVREATDRAEAAAREVRNAADAEIARAREQSMGELQQERNVMLADLRSQVVTLAMAAAQKLIGDALTQDEKRQHQLLQEFFSGVRDGKLVVLDGHEISGAAAEITSALPLTPDEQEVIKHELLNDLSSGATVSFRVDPSILGGLIVRTGDRVIDGSVSGQLQTLRQSL